MARGVRTTQRRPRLWSSAAVLVLLVLAGCRAAQPEGAADLTPAPTPSATFPRPPAASFTLTTLEGDTISLEDCRGKVVLLNFWASWCPSCRSEMASLESYEQAHREEGLVVLGINYEEDPATVRSFIADAAVTFPMLLDEDGEVAAAYGVVGLPTSYFVDCEGRIMGFWPGAVSASALEQQLTPFLAECGDSP